jgi:hypothetical protein
MFIIVGYIMLMHTARACNETSEAVLARRQLYLTAR